MRKIVLASLVCLECFLILLLCESFFGLTCVYRRDFNRAFYEWSQNPSPQTETNLQYQRRINQRVRHSADGTIAMLLLANAVAICFFWRRIRTAIQKPAATSVDARKQKGVVIRIGWYIGIATWILYQAAFIDVGGRHQDRDILNAIFWIVVGPALLYIAVRIVRRVVRWALGRERQLVNPRYLFVRLIYGAVAVALACTTIACFASAVLVGLRVVAAGCVSSPVFETLLGLFFVGLGLAVGWRWRYWSVRARERL